MVPAAPAYSNRQTHSPPIRGGADTAEFPRRSEAVPLLCRAEGSWILSEQLPSAEVLEQVRMLSNETEVGEQGRAEEVLVPGAQFIFEGHCLRLVDRCD